MKYNLIKIICLSLVFLHCSYRISKAEEFIQSAAAIHICSTISDGKYRIADIARIARQNNIDILIITERDLMRWEYGLWPLRNIIKKTKEINSVFRYGIKRYLNEIKRIQDSNPDLVLLAGAESAPFYYWQGNFLNDTLKILNWHKHILVLGLEKFEDYRNLPIIGNWSALRLPFRIKDTYRLWPILILIAGILCLPKRRFKYKDSRGQALGPYSPGWRRFGVILIVIGFLFFLNNWPFHELKFDQYQGDLGIIPYQNFIDYVNQRGGLAFWAHPDAEFAQKRGRIEIETRGHASDLLKTNNYTGFSIFCEGYKKAGRPGGIWDEILKQYCRGERSAPIWTIAGLCYDQGGDLDTRMKNLRNLILIPELNKAAVLEALRKGRVYVVSGNEARQFVLDKFMLSGTLSEVKSTMGQELDLEGQAIIEIKGHFLREHRQPVKIRLIRNGQIIKIFEQGSNFDISYPDDYQGEEKKIYYRLEIQSGGLLLVTNPIFVKRSPVPF